MSDRESSDSELPEYSDVSNSTVEVRTDSDTHVGFEKKTGGWLENEADRILRFAGFKTQRERKVIFEESTDEHYRVDILAHFDDLTLFVECKDYSEIKVNEKILFTLIGQVYDYRRDHPNETVVGILVTSAKNLGQNMGIQNKLLRENCQLWDGNTIQKLQDQMIDMDGKLEFREYLFDKLGYASELENLNEQKISLDQHKFYCRMSFFSIPAAEYVGNKFSHRSIINDLKDVLENTGITISSVSYKNINPSEDERLNLIVDFEKIFTKEHLQERWMRKSKWFRKPRETPIELMEIDFETACRTAVQKTYGIETYDISNNYPINCIATRSR